MLRRLFRFAFAPSRLPIRTRSFRPGVERLEEREVPAQIWQVTSLADTGPGTLRNILTGVQRDNNNLPIASGDTVVFNVPGLNVPGTINLVGTITASVSVNIIGNLRTPITITTNNADRVLTFVNPAGNLTENITGLTFQWSMGKKGDAALFCSFFVDPHFHA